MWFKMMERYAERKDRGNVTILSFFVMIVAVLQEFLFLLLTLINLLHKVNLLILRLHVAIILIMMEMGFVIFLGERLFVLMVQY